MGIRIGTASWAAKSLVESGLFYPPEVRTAEARLAYYATQFPLVEVDSSYYAMPTAANSRAWVARSPEDFIFNVKAFRLFTGHAADTKVLPADLRSELRARGSASRLCHPGLSHPRLCHPGLDPGSMLSPGTAPAPLRYAALPADLRFELWQRFATAIEPLQTAGKLGAVHFQFAPSVRNTPEGRAHVEHCARMLPGHLLAAEFRHRSWFDSAASTASTLDLLRNVGLAHTVVDCPQGYENTVPAIWAVTNEQLAVVRLHGRNEAAWMPKGGTASGQRFNYDYDDAELAAMAPRIESLSGQADGAHVVFNNNHDSQGQRNARALAKLMGLAA